MSPHVAAIGPGQVRGACLKAERRGLARGLFSSRQEHADAPHAVGLLRPRPHQPRHRTPEPRDEPTAFRPPVWTAPSEVSLTPAIMRLSGWSCPIRMEGDDDRERVANRHPPRVAEDRPQQGPPVRRSPGRYSSSTATHSPIAPTTLSRRRSGARTAAARERLSALPTSCFGFTRPSSREPS